MNNVEAKLLLEEKNKTKGVRTKGLKYIKVLFVFETVTQICVALTAVFV